MNKRVVKRKIKKDYQAKKLSNPFFRKKTKEKPDKSFLGLKLFMAFTLFLIFIYSFFINSFWSIKEVEVKRNERVRSELVKDIVFEQIEKDSFLFFKQSNIFNFRKKIAAETIKKEFNLTDIKISKKLPSKIIIELIERPYAFIFNESGEYYFSSIDNYLMSRIEFGTEIEEGLESEREELILESEIEGLDGDEIKKDEHHLDLVVISLEEKDKYIIIENKNNSSLIKNKDKLNLNTDYLNFILNLNRELKAHQEFPVDRFIISDQYFKSVFVKLKDGPQIYFNVNTDTSLQIENLILVKNNKIKDNFNSLEYIDLRYGDKIYFFPENIVK